MTRENIFSCTYGILWGERVAWKDSLCRLSKPVVGRIQLRVVSDDMPGKTACARFLVHKCPRDSMLECCFLMAADISKG